MSSTAVLNWLKSITTTWLIESPVTCLIVDTSSETPPYSSAAFRRVVTVPPAVWIGTISSRGIEIIEIQGLLGSIRTSNISLE